MHWVELSFLWEKEEEEVKAARIALVNEAKILEDSIQTRFKKYISEVKNELEETYKLLDYDFIAGNSDVINQHIKKTGVASTKLNRFIQSSKRIIKQKTQQTLSFVDKQRDEYLLTEYKTKNRNNVNLSSVVSGFVEKVKMPKPLSEQVPFFYKKLFLGDHAAPLKIEHREIEIEQAQKAIQLMNRKSGGAILVLGEQLSGKKYFTDYVSARMMKRTVITINPIVDNVLIMKSFEKSVNNAFGNESGLQRNLTESKGKTIVFNNIEKWGSNIEIIEFIKRAIDEYGKKHHFILNCSSVFYSYLRKLCDLDEVVISTILIYPIRKDGFTETFRLKHQAGGIKFFLNNKKETEFTERQLNLLFQKYHSLYRGNIGRAFVAWINNIQSIEGNEMYIKEPKSIYFPDVSNPEWLVLLKVFVLYTEVSRKQLETIFGSDFNSNSILNQMRRIRLISEPKNGVFELNKEVYFPVKRYLTDKKIIE